MSDQPTGSFPAASKTTKGAAASGGSSYVEGNPTAPGGAGGSLSGPTTAEEMGITGGNDMSLRGIKADYKGGDHTRPAEETVYPGNTSEATTAGPAGDQVKQVHSHEVDKVGGEPRMS